ncbi:MAG: hypothetical protein FNT15_03695 [Sulfurovum sp.]|jgi:hypothetical protein|nr:MAG: hypothetical protein FNT15_03695 [Sulfurovum sp.]
MKEKAKQFIKIELLKHNINYVQLSKLMKVKGYDYSSDTIRTKIHRGSFSFAFFLEVCDSLEINFVCLDKMNIS